MSFRTGNCLTNSLHLPLCSQMCFHLVLHCLSAYCNPPPILTRYFHFLFFTYYAHMFDERLVTISRELRMPQWVSP